MSRPWKGVCCQACWEAQEKRCRCKCKGKFHGKGKSRRLGESTADEEEVKA